MDEGAIEEGGTLLPVLREEAWPHAADFAHRRLLPVERGPLVTYGHDTPKVLRRVTAAALGARPLADLEAEALRNLAARKVDMVLQGDVLLLADEYAPELLLLPERMREVAARLGTERFVALVPEEKALYAARFEADPTRLCAFARSRFDASTRRRISPMPLLVMQGEVVGFLEATDPVALASEQTVIDGGGPRPPGAPDRTPWWTEYVDEKKPWWRFW